MLYANMANWITIFESSDLISARTGTAEKEEEREKLRKFMWKLIWIQNMAFLILFAAQGVVMVYGFATCLAVNCTGMFGLYLTIWLFVKVFLDSFAHHFFYNALWPCLPCQLLTVFGSGFTIFYELDADGGPAFPKGFNGHGLFDYYAANSALTIMIMSQLFMLFCSSFVFMLGCHILPVFEKPEEEIDPSKVPHVITLQTL